MANPTTNLGMTKPTVGGSTDTWGTTINENVVDIIDALFSVTGTDVSMSDITFASVALEETGAGTDTVKVQAPSAVTTSYTLTMPAAVGTTNQVLSLADGTGTLAWSDPEVGDITGVTAGAGMTGGGTSGDVTLNVIGTADKITVSADAVTIASTYVGQSSITTLGTIASLVATTADINGGTFDGIVGGTTPADGSFTTLSASSTLLVAGATTLSSTLTVTGGVATFSSNVVSDTDSTDDLGTTGVRWANLWVDDVVATTTVKPGTLVLAAGSITDTSGAITFGNENLVTTGTFGAAATTLSSTLGVTGATTLSSTLAVTGAASLSSTLAVTGTSALTGSVGIGAANLSAISSVGRVLSITSGSGGEIIIQRNDSLIADGNIVGGLAFFSNDTQNPTEYSGIQARASGTAGFMDLNFYGKSGSYGSNTPDMTIDTNGAISMAGSLSVDDTTQTSSGTTGSIHTDGGLGVAKDLFVAGNISVAATSGVYFDGGAHTLIKENSPNVLRCVAGGSGGVDLTNGATSWTAVSDERAKILEEPIIDAMAKLGTLRTVFGTFRDDHQKIRHPFLVAQDVLAVYPEAVALPEEEDLYRLSYTDMVPLLVAGQNETSAALSNAQARIETLEARLEAAGI